MRNLSIFSDSNGWSDVSVFQISTVFQSIICMVYATDMYCRNQYLFRMTLCAWWNGFDSDSHHPVCYSNDRLKVSVPRTSVYVGHVKYHTLHCGVNG